MQWIDFGLNVRFGEDFRSLLTQAREENNFERFLRAYEYRQEMVDNMDF